MKALRYIITRPCLQEGSLRLLKYLEGTFPSAGPVVLVDDHGQEHHAQVDLQRRAVTGLGSLYHAQNLGVNDVLMITPLTPGRFQVDSIVKPHAPPPAPRREQPKAPETRRVVVATTPHVREVRLQEVRAPLALSAEPTSTRAAPSEPTAPTERPTPEPAPRVTTPAQAAVPLAARPAPTKPTVRPLDVRFDAPRQPQPSPPPAPIRSRDDAAHLAELARLTGYRLEDLGSGVLRLNAELGAHSYAVLIATSEAAVRADAWKERADYCVLLTGEADRAVNTPRLTREALEALTEHAQLAPLTPVDLRGYWKAGSVDLEAAASVAELVGAHLAQRGAFSAVLLTLAQQPAHSLVSVQRLAERLGSGVNYAELGSILDTLTRAPFLALTPLPGGQYLLRSGVTDLLSELAEYAEGLRRRTRVPLREAVPA
ncbi:hypothetical protein [Deinococcus radiotolerans]|uniref:DUF4388 domain-containing protein n=1 Tax=Deinococcus radiotolerans TaxID=1309407 RepID=A0ABQ2FMH1_9DEIO|nr:hypothetical protein [Deinococcus radiotolerans]GGL03869.1 hypothetical protein GCM10010844_23120 [Deinococcus radiotolerans]